MESHETFGIDQDIAPELEHVSASRLGQPTPGQLLQVRPPRGEPPHVAPPASLHLVRTIQLTSMIDEDGPGHARLLDIGARERSLLEGDDHDAKPRLETFCVPLQLQQVPAARQSPEVAVEDHEQPHTPIVVQTMEAAAHVRQRKRRGGPPLETRRSRVLHVILIMQLI